MNLPASFSEQDAKQLIFSQLISHAYPPPSEPLPPAFILPNAYWSPDDKASFFLSLARHSRWRPDIIAEDIGGGKSTADVCSYIELLEQGSTRNGRKDQRSRDALSSAHEVSEEWIEVEESVANLLYQEEGQWREATAKRKHAETLKEVKEASRREEAKQDVPKDSEEFAAEPNRKRRSVEQEEQETWRERYKRRKRELTALWKRDDLLSSLDGRYLKTLETLVRNLEEEEDGKEEHQDNAGDDTLQRTQTSSGPPPAPGVPAVSSVPDRPNVNTIDNSHIDPSLLALDAPPHSIASSSQHVSRSRLQNLIPSTPRHNVSNTLLPVPFPQGPYSQDLPSDLSPTSRRRIRKRLWMRQKRALLNGVPMSEVSTDTRKLKPGRKGTSSDQKGKSKEKDASASEEPRHSKFRTLNGPGLSDQANETDRRSVENDDGDDSADGSEQPRRKKLYGWAKLKAVDVDGTFLRAEGLDLFHLSRLGSMTSLLRNIYKVPKEKGDEDNESDEPALSYSILCLLRAHVVHFITRLLAQVIIQKHVETQQKKRVKGKFQKSGSLEVRAENVHNALNIMGEEMDHKHFFKKLKATVRSVYIPDAELPGSKIRSRHDPKETYTDGSELPSEDSDSESNNDTDTSSEADTGVRVNDQAVSSFQTLPLTFIPQPLLTLLWNPELMFHGRSDETLLSEDTDEEALRKELKAEEKVEDADQETDINLERALWTELGVEPSEHLVPPEVPAVTDGTSRPHGQQPGSKAANLSLRFLQPNGVIKSRVYIDSDEDDELV